ncbi:circularly permuted type 2 ATP-grasp protein [Pelomonas sp. SE-A7]|nr:circularly permuted type 2 ATP-grasp protein [Pelomonas sp. SE-A7]MDM4768340.1 circularly permuted type 2 ATP-grasp protein [Pelomonas sp. SE-A7]
MLLADGRLRPHYQAFGDWLQAQSPETLAKKRTEADLLFHKVGITFAVYGDEAGAERLIPFDMVPRIVPASEWTMLEKGLRQRVTALNRFLWDIYHDHEILKAGLIPAEQVLGNAQYQKAMQGLDLPHGIYAHITGVDLIRHSDGGYYVLEDNLRVPSGVSYMLENRKMMMRLFPELFSRYSIAPVQHYPTLLLNTLRHASPVDNPTAVVLTPGPFNSAYFEHAFLAQQMGVELVEGQDLFVKDDWLYMRTTVGPKRVDVIYRRIDDAFLDPLAFRPDSMLGVPGLLSVYQKGHLILANAIGTGVADDKSIYPYVPDMIRFYLGEEPILNNVPTWQCRKAADLDHVLNHMKDLVVKEVHGAGGYGMLVGPASTAAEVEDFKLRVKANPSNYIAQPTLCLSSCPTFVESGIAPRHIDLRPFVLTGREITMVAGGLTRVALKEGSLVVNSSQGGGTKDTWILETDVQPPHSLRSLPPEGAQASLGAARRES